MIGDKFPSKKGLMKLYFHISENSGVGLYRQYQLAEELQRQGKANVLINDFTWGQHHYGLTKDGGRSFKYFDEKEKALKAIESGEFPLQELHEVALVEPSLDTLIAICNWADLVIVGRSDVANYVATWGALKEFFNMPMIMDTDDNVRFVRPSNPGYSSYHPGSEHIEWNKFATRRVFDALTVSTDNLKEFHQKENPKIFVVPNSIDFKVWTPQEKKPGDRIRICFNGSASHWEGMRLVESSIIKILKEFPNVTFITAKVYSQIFDAYPELKPQIEYFPWIPLKEFADGMKKLQVDIALAPLTDNMFNRAKSNLRWLENSALKIPVIVSPVEAYKNVVHNETGLVAREKEDWYTCIKALVLDEKLRTTLAENAYKEVREKFNLEINAPKVLPFFEDVVKKYHALLGAKKRYTQTKKGWQELK
jgi:processive 1,2-diacylglycerol beta-glucosyltransferase